MCSPPCPLCPLCPLWFKLLSLLFVGMDRCAVGLPEAGIRQCRPVSGVVRLPLFEPRRAELDPKTARGPDKSPTRPDRAGSASAEKALRLHSHATNSNERRPTA